MATNMKSALVNPTRKINLKKKEVTTADYAACTLGLSYTVSLTHSLSLSPPSSVSEHQSPHCTLLSTSI